MTGPDLTRIREEADLTQTQVAEELGVVPSAVSRYEGKARVKPGLVTRYIEAVDKAVAKRQAA